MIDLIDGLNEEQKQVVTFGEGPLLVLAGAGSGKTKVLTHRAAYLVAEKGVDPSSIVLLTFTNKAAAEMKERANRLMGKNQRIGFAGTFHTFCVRILRSYGRRINVNHDFTIYDSDDSESLMKEVIKELGITDKEVKPNVFLSIIGKKKNDLVSLGDTLSGGGDLFFQQVGSAWRLYQEKLRKYNAMDFDDLLVKTVELLRIDEVKEKINETFKWILVDEYQDVNKAQFVITKLLTGTEANITAVGDASQAIYSFRGADFRNLLLLETEYPNLTKISLPKNYRSTQKILDAAYGVINNNISHPVIKLDAVNETGETVELVETIDEKDEARQVVTRAIKATTGDSEAAILYRTNAQSRAFEDELMKRGTPYKLVGGLRFYNRAEIKDLIAYLKILANPLDEISRTRVLKIGKRRYEKFETWYFGLGEEKKKENPGKLLEEIINTTEYLDKFDERDEEDRARIENINELLAVASEFADPLDFLTNAALSEASEKEMNKNAKIILMTIHAAKGLEFDSVFVAGLEEGIFPHSRTLFAKEEIEEERRLMYVAMTRARKNLTLSFARSRLVYGGRNSTYPSRFLGEIPVEHIKRREVETFKINERTPKREELDDFGEKKRIIVPDWEIEAETKDDFADIDNW